MSVVAPISATAAAVPVLVGLAEGERPSTLQVAGMAIALAGVILASREPVEEGCRDPPNRAAIGLALVAAAGFGTFFVGIDQRVGDRRGAVGDRRPALLLARAARDRGAGGAADAPARRPEPARRSAWSACSTSAPTASTRSPPPKGLLSVVSVLGSLYPAVTVVLARFVLAERIARVQEVGVVLALAGVVAISAG